MCSSGDSRIRTFQSFHGPRRYGPWHPGYYGVAWPHVPRWVKSEICYQVLYKIVCENKLLGLLGLTSGLWELLSLIFDSKIQVRCLFTGAENKAETEVLPSDYRIRHVIQSAHCLFPSYDSIPRFVLSSCLGTRVGLLPISFECSISRAFANFPMHVCLNVKAESNHGKRARDCSCHWQWVHVHIHRKWNVISPELK